MKSFTVGWRGSSPQSLHDYNNGPAGTADRVLGTSPFEKDEIDTIKIFANLFSHHYLQSTIANVIYLLSIIHEKMYMVRTEVLQILIVKLRQGSGKVRQGKARKGKDGER